MKFLIFSRQMAENKGIVDANCLQTHIWIGIHDTDKQPPNLPLNRFRFATLFLAFDDADKPGVDNYTKKPIVPISPEQSQQIVNFVVRWKDKVDLICVNCEAGKSRSAAIAFILSMLLNGHDSGILGDDYFAPNNTVKDSILISGKPLANDNTPRVYWSRWQEEPDEQNANPNRDVQQEPSSRDLSSDSTSQPKVSE
jgi:hypothetical protein